MTHRLLATKLAGTILFLLCVAGNLLAQTYNVRARFKAMQKNWSKGKGDPVTFILYFSLICVASLVLYYLLRCYYQRKERKKSTKARPVEKVQTNIEEAELSSREIKLLTIVTSSVDQMTLDELLSSPARFDEAVGHYLRRFCTHHENSGPVISALIIIRKKLCSNLWQDLAFAARWTSRFKNRGVSGSAKEAKRALLNVNTIDLHGLESIPLLSWVQATPLSRESDTVKCRVIEKPGNALRLQVRCGEGGLTWDIDDRIRLQVAIEHQGHPEFLARVVRVDAPMAGLCLVEYETAGSPDEYVSYRDAKLESKDLPCTARFVPLEEGDPAEISVEAIDMQGAFFRTGEPVSAGDTIQVGFVGNDPGLERPVPATVLYCCRGAKRQYTVEARFDDLSEAAARYIHALYVPNEKQLSTVASSDKTDSPIL